MKCLGLSSVCDRLLYLNPKSSQSRCDQCSSYTAEDLQAQGVGKLLTSGNAGTGAWASYLPQLLLHLTTLISATAPLPPTSPTKLLLLNAQMKWCS
jgi:hypothetical protein